VGGKIAFGLADPSSEWGRSAARAEAEAPTERNKTITEVDRKCNSERSAKIVQSIANLQTHSRLGNEKFANSSGVIQSPAPSE